MYDVQEMRQDLKETIRDHYCFRDGKDESEREFDLLQNITCSNSEFDWALEGGGATGATVSFSASPVNLSFSASPQFLCFPLSLSNSKSDEDEEEKKEIGIRPLPPIGIQ